MSRQRQQCSSPQTGCMDSLLAAMQQTACKGRSIDGPMGRGCCRERSLLKGRTLHSLQMRTHVCVTSTLLGW